MRPDCAHCTAGSPFFFSSCRGCRSRMIDAGLRQHEEAATAAAVCRALLARLGVKRLPT